MAVLDGAFGDLRRLADWFSTSPQRPPSLHIERIVKRLGGTGVPLLGRNLASIDPRRREAARDCLAFLATIAAARTRVIDELRAILGKPITDELKVCVLGLLAELGAPAEAHFTDARAMQRRSALALAAQLDTPGDVASAADMMIRQLSRTDLVEIVELLSEAAPAAAERLARELDQRLDLEAVVREHVTSLIASSSPATPTRPPRPTQVAVLVDANARIVVVASRKMPGERRWRRWAVLIGAAGQIDDCLHEEATPSKPGGPDADAAPLIASLVADGYRVASSDLDHARTVVAAAARLCVARDPSTLSSAYYLGRDLLDLGDAHMGARRDPDACSVARALEHIADGEVPRALALLEAHPRPDDVDHHAAVAACALAQQRHADAVEPLSRAITLEPAWPLHHWNLAAALHALGDPAGCYHALRRFLATSARPTALHGDPDQPERIAYAERMLGELERAARLAGTSFTSARRAPGGARRRRTKASKPRATKARRRAAVRRGESAPFLRAR